ncbi:MAG: CpcT/CpeT family chromophore lyase [Gammaproteobacteria bacterium]
MASFVPMMIKRAVMVRMSGEIACGAFFVGGSLALTSCASHQSEDVQATDLTAELREIVSLFTGHYRGLAPDPLARNDPQVPATMEVFHRVAQIDAPQFGGIVLYHQLNRERLDGPAIQRKIYAFDTDVSRANNRMKAYYILPEQPWIDLDRNPDAVKEIAPDELKSFPVECDMNWTSQLGTIEAVIKPGACLFESTAFGQTVRAEMTYTVNKDGFDLYEAMYTATGDTIFDMDDPISSLRMAPANEE